MSTGWENHEPAPIEYLHHELMEIFHETRRMTVGQDTHTIEMDGILFNRMIAEAKTRTYRKYEKLKLKQAILKSMLK